MGDVPQRLDLTRTSHFLFEVGSLLLTVFGGLFTVCAITVGLAYAFGYWWPVGVLAAFGFGLLAVSGVGLLYASLRFEHGSGAAGFEPR